MQCRTPQPLQLTVISLRATGLGPEEVGPAGHPALLHLPLHLVLRDPHRLGLVLPLVNAPQVHIVHPFLPPHHLEDPRELPLNCLLGRTGVALGHPRTIAISAVQEVESPPGCDKAGEHGGDVANVLKSQVAVHGVVPDEVHRGFGDGELQSVVRHKLKPVERVVGQQLTSQLQPLLDGNGRDIDSCGVVTRRGEVPRVPAPSRSKVDGHPWQGRCTIGLQELDQIVGGAVKLPADLRVLGLVSLCAVVLIVLGGLKGTEERTLLCRKQPPLAEVVEDLPLSVHKDVLVRRAAVRRAVVVSLGVLAHPIPATLPL
eukprot:Sspe_Gene.69627::Locus_41053_Transcript_1_1_Confidence_1.000_Length_1675::g.69627::m.69627